jgi:hypothetical protein
MNLQEAKEQKFIYLFKLVLTDDNGVVISSSFFYYKTKTKLKRCHVQ